MNRHLRYLTIVLRHKWYVLKFGWGTVPIWRLLIHDWTKFTRAEWPAYVDRFISGRAGQEDKTQDSKDFADAWQHHWQHNPHHWEYWANRDKIIWVGRPCDSRYSKKMPLDYIFEMVADWKAASKVYSGKDDCREWYRNTCHRQIMHPETRVQVELILGVIR